MPIELVGTTGITTPGMESTAMPTVGGAAVVESGSNTDGEWTKFADGTQEISCQINIGVNATASTAYPQAFTSVSSVQLTGYHTSTYSSDIALDGSSRVASPSLTGTVIRNRSTDIGNDVFVHVTGRWK